MATVKMTCDGNFCVRAHATHETDIALHLSLNLVAGRIKLMNVIALKIMKNCNQSYLTMEKPSVGLIFQQLIVFHCDLI